MTGAAEPATRALILSGAGRYADPWHPFAATSSRLAEVIAECVTYVTIDEDIDTAMTRLDGVDLVIVNAGDPARSCQGAPDLRDAISGFRAALDRGMSVLALHAAASSLGDYSDWEDVLGGRWVPGESMHPPIGAAHVHVHSSRHAVVRARHDFDLVDERYSRLRIAPDVVPLASHTLDGEEQPLLWARTRGNSRIVYDALGHDERSYESTEHRELLRSCVRWLLPRR